MKVPCKECLLISMCRHKYYSNLFRECSLVAKFVNSPGKHNGRIVLVHDALKPTKWEAQRDHGDIRLTRKLRGTFGEKIVDYYDSGAFS